VDAYRVSTNHEDAEATIDPLSEMMVNKASELATESIPGCVLQLYVWLTNPDELGTSALVSIAISAATTGFSQRAVIVLITNSLHQVRGWRFDLQHVDALGANLPIRGAVFLRGQRGQQQRQQRDEEQHHDVPRLQLRGMIPA